MIQDRRQIQINEAPENVFDVIETMPNKFPVYKILETKPFFFIRILFVDGLRGAIEAVNAEKSSDALILNVGDSMGPFKLTELEKPFKYWFTLKSFFFNCQTGYSLDRKNGMTILHFDLIAEKSSFMEKGLWFFVKPFHGLFAHKVLNVIKERIESIGRNDPCPCGSGKKYKKCCG